MLIQFGSCRSVKIFYAIKLLSYTIEDKPKHIVSPTKIAQMQQTAINQQQQLAYRQLKGVVSKLL